MESTILISEVNELKSIVKEMRKQFGDDIRVKYYLNEIENTLNVIIRRNYK